MAARDAELEFAVPAKCDEGPEVVLSKDGFIVHAVYKTVHRVVDGGAACGTKTSEHTHFTVEKLDSSCGMPFCRRKGCAPWATEEGVDSGDEELEHEGPSMSSSEQSQALECGKTTMFSSRCASTTPNDAGCFCDLPK